MTSVTSSRLYRGWKCLQVLTNESMKHLITKPISSATTAAKEALPSSFTDDGVIAREWPHGVPIKIKILRRPVCMGSQ